MTRRPLTVFGAAWVGACAVLTALNLVLLALTADLPVPPGAGGRALEVIAAMAYLAAAVVGALILSRHRHHPVGWVFALGAMALAFAGFASEYAAYTLVGPGSALPAGRAVAWLGAWMWWTGFGATVTFLFLLFPDGRPPSRAWHPVVVVATINLVLLAAGHAFAPGALHREYAITVNPMGVDAVGGLFTGLRSAGWILVTANLLVAVTALVTRLRRSRGDQRQQLKWLAYAGSLIALAIPAWALTSGSGAAPPIPVQLVEGLAFMSVPIAAGVAILRYRLYDIDLVINKTLVFGALAAFITAVYAVLIAGVGLVAQTVGTLPVSIAATAIVVIGFQPVRDRFQVLANQIVFGQRVTPYEAVTQFSERMSRTLSADDTLPEMAMAAANAVGGKQARVRLFLPGGGVEEVTWPQGGTGPFDHAVPIVHQDVKVGEICVAKARGDALTERDESLLAGLALQAGPVLRNLRLTEELQQRLKELQASRQRIVAAQDQERRRVERDLHDGAQQTLVSMSAKLGLAKRLLDDRARAEVLLQELGSDLSEAVDRLRDLARGIFPPMLVERGLAAALEMHVMKTGLDADLDADGVAGVRFPREIEAALYFCAVEALQNVSKHAPAAEVSVGLRLHGGSVELCVRDAGPGFDTGAANDGSGLENMADRLEAVGGSLEVVSAPGRGTMVRARARLPQ